MKRRHDSGFNNYYKFILNSIQEMLAVHRLDLIQPINCEKLRGGEGEKYFLKLIKLKAPYQCLRRSLRGH